MSTIKVIGIDLGKSSFHLVGHDHTGREQFSKHLSRSKLIQLLSQIPHTNCTKSLTIQREFKAL